MTAFYMSPRKRGEIPLLELTLPGRPRVLKNGKRIFGRYGRKIVLPSVKYAAWEQNAIAACNRANRTELITIPVVAVYRFYLANRSGEPDVSNLCEGPGDVLQRAGILQNDKLIVRLIAEKFFGEEPRTEIELYAFEK